MKRDLLERALEIRDAGGVSVIATELASGRQELIDDRSGASGLPSAVEEAARAALARDRSHVVEGWFLHVVSPPARLLIVGAVHIAQALAPMATLAGYAVTVIDPRGSFASEARFGQVALDRRWPDEALAALKPDRRSAIVTLSHDPKLDDPALIAALHSPAFYIGALGSRKTQAARATRLSQAGFGDTDLARIHGPVGLAIGALTAPEIAVSILAEITKIRRGTA